jgi:hypothetical protein
VLDEPVVREFKLRASHACRQKSFPEVITSLAEHLLEDTKLLCGPFSKLLYSARMLLGTLQEPSEVTLKFSQACVTEWDLRYGLSGPAKTLSKRFFGEFRMGSFIMRAKVHLAQFPGHRNGSAKSRNGFLYTVSELSGFLASVLEHGKGPRGALGDVFIEPEDSCLEIKVLDESVTPDVPSLVTLPKEGPFFLGSEEGSLASCHFKRKGWVVKVGRGHGLCGAIPRRVFTCGYF